MLSAKLFQRPDLIRDSSPFYSIRILLNNTIKKKNVAALLQKVCGVSILVALNQTKRILHLVIIRYEWRWIL